MGIRENQLFWFSDSCYACLEFRYGRVINKTGIEAVSRPYWFIEAKAGSAYRLFHRRLTKGLCVSHASTYRPPRGCAFLLFAMAALWLGCGLYGVLLDDEIKYAAIVCMVPFAALAVLFGIASRLVRTVVDDLGLRVFHEPLRFNTVAFRWDEVEWWQETQVVDPETNEARSVVEFQLRGRRWPVAVEPIGVAMPGLAAFLADIRTRIGAKERPNLKSSVNPDGL